MLTKQLELLDFIALHTTSNYVNSPIVKAKRQYPFKQALKVLYNKGSIRMVKEKRSYCYRLMSHDVTPVRNLHGRTFKALLNKQILVKQADDSYMLKDSLQNQ